MGPLLLNSNHSIYISRHNPVKLKTLKFPLSNKFHPSLLSLLTPNPPHSVSLSTRSEWGDRHPGTRNDGSEHPLQPPVHPAARARLSPECLHSRQHGHPHLQPPAAAGHGPAGHPAGTTPAPGHGPAWAPQGGSDPRLQEEVHQEGEEVELDRGRWRNDSPGPIWWEIQPPIPSPLCILLLCCLLL